MRAPSGVLAAVVAFIVVGGCARGTPEAEVEAAGTPCVAVTGPLESARDPRRLVGSFHLALMATRGAGAGREFSGALTLRSGDSGVVGTADLPVAELGAERTGDLMSEDPGAPGARVVDGGSILVVRLGADANRLTTEAAIEGPVFALHVREIDEHGFAGTWLSGSGMDRAEGHFCATRT